MVVEGPGWPEEAYDLLVRLEGDPPLSVLETYREEHDRLIRQPMERLCDALGEVGVYGRAWQSGLSHRPAAWQGTSATVWIARRVRMTVRFDLDGLVVEGGWTGPAGDQLPRYRAAVDAEHSGPELVEIITDLDKAGYVMLGEPLQRVPRGYPPEHPRAELLRRRDVFCGFDLGIGPWLATPAVVDRVREAFDPLLPLTAWFVDYIATNGFSAVT